MDIEPVLNLMPKPRALLIEKYLTYRIHKYLGIIKYGENKPFANGVHVREAEQSMYKYQQ